MVLATYLGNKIVNNELDYSYAISKRPDLKTEIDTYLEAKGYGNLIV